ncbi:hypothetical protein PTI98_004025 [Pleurotus ostreatus]|nr:hypothetical protein PTI98_004025 [Pleurotus ostreatus]
MPIELKKGSEEKLPKINKRFFAGKKPANERAITKTFIEFVGTDNFPEIQIVDTSAHPDPNSKSGAKLRPDLSVRDINRTSSTPTHLRNSTTRQSPLRRGG